MRVQLGKSKGVDRFALCTTVITPPRRARRAAMALAALSGDEQCIIFSRLCNVLVMD